MHLGSLIENYELNEETKQTRLYSSFQGNLSSNEYVVYDRNQVTVRYVVQFSE